MDLKATFMGLVFVIIWSSAFTSAHIIVQHAPPLLALSLRFALAGVIGVCLALMLGQSWRISPSQWGAIITFGILQNAVYLGANFSAMQHIEASLAAIIASTLPFFVALISRIFFKERLSLQGLCGLLAGFLGVVIIMQARLGGQTPQIFGIALCFIGVIALAFATLIIRRTKTGQNLLMVVGLQMLVGAVVVLPFGLILEPLEFRVSPSFFIAFAYTVIMPGLVATWIWFRLVEHIGAVKGASYHFLNPFFGVLVAALILDEAIRLGDIIGVIIIMGGIYVVQNRDISAPTRAS